MLLRVAFALFPLLLAAPALAQAPKTLGSYKGWSVWQYSDGGRSRCFIYATPDKATPPTLDHGLVSFFVRKTVRPEIKSEASLQVGYPFKERSEAQVAIDGEKFRMLTQEKGAWLAKGGAREGELLEAMKVGRTMTVTARSARGNETAYVFTLAGVTDAMKRLRSACP